MPKSNGKTLNFIYFLEARKMVVGEPQSSYCCCVTALLSIPFAYGSVFTSPVAGSGERFQDLGTVMEVIALVKTSTTSNL